MVDKAKGHWYEGVHEPLVERDVWDRVAVLLGQKIYRSHELTYAGEMVTCGYCGQTITGERKIKKTKKGEREYVYYRCAKYNRPGHPRIRLKESDLDAQMVHHFERMRIDDDEVRTWVTDQLRKSNNLEETESKNRIKELNRQISLLHSQQSRLVNMRMLDEIDAETFASTKTELRDREAKLELQLASLKRARHEVADLAMKAFELSQSLSRRWFTADHAEKRRIMEIVCLNFLLDDVSLIPVWRKPFEILSEGLLISSSRAERI
ncbi:zinc ribbon domain-containing protein [Aeoliella sp. SH292]|uniref:zinc ribbon domain-containing protein n=1 Tax=Aeoliella sp. SH292 TaxID=3454464 RepID=UPI003F9E38C0